MHCAHCSGALAASGVLYTASCGHVFHEDCARTCSIGQRQLSCPDCNALPRKSAADGKPWRTYWEASSGPSQEQETVVTNPRHVPLPSACWRRVARVQVRVQELESAVESSRKELDSEKSRVSRTEAVESRLRQEILALKRELVIRRERSMRHVVASCAQKCFSSLLHAQGEPHVVRLLQELRKSHGHALPVLFAVQQRILTLLQSRYTERAAYLRQLRDAVRALLIRDGM